MYGDIEVTCETDNTLRIQEMTEFQGNLKYRTEDDYSKILSSMQKRGIAFPFFIWVNNNINYVLDGHGRIGALKRAIENGFNVPPLPVVYITSPDEKHAKNLLLRLNSKYGTITLSGVAEFIKGVNVDLSDIKIPELPHIENQIEILLSDISHLEESIDEIVLKKKLRPIFNVYCPECGEKYDISEDELKEVVGYEN